MHEQLTEWWNGVSLRTKITGVTVLLLTLGLVVAGVGTMSVLRNYLLDETDKKIQRVVLPASAIEYDDSSGSPQCRVAIYSPEYYLAVVSSDGQLLCDNRSAAQDRPVLAGLTLSRVTAQDGAFTLLNQARLSQWRVFGFPLGIQQSTNDQVTVVIGLNLDDTNALIARYAGIFLFFGMSVVVLGGALTRLLVTSTFTPLREVEATAARFAAGDFTQRLGGATPNTEVGRLNQSLNAMLKGIDTAFADRARTIDQMRRFVGDASHELRTPLVSVRGYAELYRMGALSSPEEVAQAMERIEKEAIRMGELVQDLLELARIDEAKPLNLHPVDLVPLAHDAALDAMASAPDRRVSVVVTEPVVASPAEASAVDVATDVRGASATPTTGAIGFAGATLARLRARRSRSQPALTVDTVVENERSTTPALILAEENKIRQVITNLMGNALRFTPAGSPIELAISVNEVDSTATIAVIDHGEGIPPQIREKIFQRFWRADSSRNRDTGGSGLGLAIVASIVASHKGTVNVVETAGGGSTFRVTFPLLHDDTPGEAVPSVE